MKIEKRTYKVFYKGKQYSLSLCAVTKVKVREKVLVRRKVSQSKS